MECNGTTHVGHVDDGLGTIQYVCCGACRTVTVDARDGRRTSWGITCLDPETLRLRREPRTNERFLDRLRSAFA